MNDEEIMALVQQPEQAVNRSVALAHALGKVTPLAKQPAFEVPPLRTEDTQLALPRDELFQRKTARNPRNTGF